MRCHSWAERDQLLDDVTDQALDTVVRLSPHRYQTNPEHHPGLFSGHDHAFNDTASYATHDQLDAEQRLIATASPSATVTLWPTISARRRCASRPPRNR